MVPASKWKEAIFKLRIAINEDSQIFGLTYCSRLDINDPNIIISYHDTLLSVMAYPFSEKGYRLAEMELKRVIQKLLQHKSTPKWQLALSNSGLPFTEIRCQYSASLVKWLLLNFPKQVNPLDADSSNDIFQQLSQAVLPGIEFHHTTQGNYNIWNRIKWLSGHYRNTAALNWLINLLEEKNWSPVLKDQLYNNLKLFVSWKLNDGMTGRSFTRLPEFSIFFQNHKKRKTNSLAIIKTKVPDPYLLSFVKQCNLISTIRSSLALYARETDPVTYADPNETRMYDMGEGLEIALTGMIIERRLALESYIGYMAFKNGIPVSYGGGWIWGQRCKIGINIYPPFRGRDSDKLFCQIMRLYFQVFHIRRFVVKPYQFGKGNPEGLKTGAFWFYYKIGFRPVNKDIRKIADLEWEKIKADKAYRTPVSILKKFTACNKEWEPEKTNLDFFDADKISITVTKMINSRFDGNRNLAIEKSMQALTQFLGLKKMILSEPVEKKVWSNWGLLFLCLPGTDKWSLTDRKKFHQLIELKSAGKEIDFIHQLQNHKKIWVSINELLNF